jgi:CHAD domain-containing protein
MAFQLKADESVVKGIRRIVRQEVDKALDSLTGRSGGGPDPDVHDARKRFKKVRAVLKLARKALGSKVYRRENAAFRDAGRPLTEVRDAQALLDILDRLAERYPAEAPPELLGGVREALRDRRQAVRRRVLEEEGAAEEVAAAVRKPAARLKRCSPGRKGWSALQGGLKDSYRRGLEAYAAASADPTVENLHEWRKRVKDLWHQLQLLRAARPQVLEPLADQAHALADLLGDDHDLAVLRQLLTDQPERLGGQAAVDRLLPLIDRSRAELQREARLVGQHVYWDPPGVFMNRLKAFWKAWRSGARAAAPGH